METVKLDKVTRLNSPRIASAASHTVAPADRFWDFKWIKIWIKGVLEVNYGCAEAYTMDLRGLLDSKSNMFCVKVWVCIFWFGLQQLLDYFLTPGELGLKSFILGNILYFALVLHIKQIDEPFEPAELEFRTPVLWKHFLE